MYHRYIFRNQQVFAHAQNKSEGCISVSIYAIPWGFFKTLPWNQAGNWCTSWERRTRWWMEPNQFPRRWGYNCTLIVHLQTYSVSLCIRDNDLYTKHTYWGLVTGWCYEYLGDSEVLFTLTEHYYDIICLNTLLGTQHLLRQLYAHPSFSCGSLSSFPSHSSVV